MTTPQLVRQFDLVKFIRQPLQVFLRPQPRPRRLGACSLIAAMRLCYPIIKIGVRRRFELR